MDTDLLSQKKTQLIDEVAAFVQHAKRQKRRASRANKIIVILGLVCSFGITFLGVGGAGELAALLGAFIAVLIGFDQAFAYGEKANFYRIIVADGENLLTDLRLGVDTEEGFKKAMQKFLVLRKYGAEKLPRGKGMETVRSMSREMSAIVGQK